MKKQLILVLIPVFIFIIPLRYLIMNYPQKFWLWSILYFIIVTIIIYILKKFF